MVNDSFMVTLKVSCRQRDRKREVVSRQKEGSKKRSGLSSERVIEKEKWSLVRKRDRKREVVCRQKKRS